MIRPSQAAPATGAVAGRRWQRLIPVAVVMYMISYVDRTNVSLALDPRISTMMRDLAMDDRLKGEAAGVFFFGYAILQSAGGYAAHRWSARKLIAVLLGLWGLCAVGCGLAQSFRQFEVARFLLGAAESGVFPAVMVLLADWFPRSELARASAYWYLCQPLAVVASAPVSGWLLGAYGWRTMIVAEGALPFVWLPVWLWLVRDRPAEAAWLPPEERARVTAAIRSEAARLEAGEEVPLHARLRGRGILAMGAICLLYNSAGYGCMIFFTAGLNERNFSALQYSLLFAAPYLLAAIVMVLNSRHSDRTGERRWHVALVLGASGVFLVVSALLRADFWGRYVFLCLSIPGPFAALAPFFSIPCETLPRKTRGAAVGLVNGIGCLGGFIGPYLIGVLKHAYGGVAFPFAVLGGGLLAAAFLTAFLPRSAARPQPAAVSAP